MANPFRILTPYNFHQLQDSFNHFPDYESPNSKGKFPDWGDIDSFCNQYGFYQENPVQELLFRPKDDQEPVKNQYHQTSYDPNDEQFRLQVQRDDEVGTSSSIPDPMDFSTNSSLDSNRTDFVGTDEKRDESIEKLSTEQILRLAGERFVQFSSQKFININMLIHPYGSSLSGLSSADKQDVELTQLLLAAAEKVAYQQYDRASRLLCNCQWIASTSNTPVQRVVSYFCEALTERIKNETRTSTEENEKPGDACQKRNILSLASMHQGLPFFQVVEFTAVQAIIEAVKMKPKIHLIDFQILTGMHWPALMQTISDQKLDPSVCMKITAVETTKKSIAERTGKQLERFARHLNLHFIYKVILLSDIKDLKEEHFEIEHDETVAVFFPFMLRTLISKPVCLKNLMTVTQKIKPSVMVVGEVEANLNSPSFVNRFIETLFFYGAFFDSLEEGMKHENENRLAIESGIFREGILNIVASEGYERVTRSVSISVWRAFFARYGMIELEVSTASLHQACLIVNKFGCGESCTLDISSKCLVVGWKGTPLFSVSAWKFY